MEPTREGPPINFELPPEQSAEQLPSDEHQEVQPARPETVGRQPRQPALPAAPDDIPAVDQPVIAAPPQDVQAPATSDTHAHVKDSDHIETEWVDKAKAIVAKTQDDPYRQKHEMSKVKADYIQKRFGKQVKTDEAPA